MNKAAAGGVRRQIAAFDKRKDFRFFVLKAKVCQVYREALQEAKAFSDPDLRQSMTEMMRDEFRVFRRRPEDEATWRLDPAQIDYHLALIRKQINFVKELRDRTS